MLRDFKTWLDVAEDEACFVENLNETYVALGFESFITGNYSENLDGFAKALIRQVRQGTVLCLTRLHAKLSFYI